MAEADPAIASIGWQLLGGLVIILLSLIVYAVFGCISQGYWESKDIGWRNYTGPFFLCPAFVLFGIILLPLMQAAFSPGKWLGQSKTSEPENQ